VVGDERWQNTGKRVGIAEVDTFPEFLSMILVKSEVGLWWRKSMRSSECLLVSLLLV